MPEKMVTASPFYASRRQSGVCRERRIRKGSSGGVSSLVEGCAALGCPDSTSKPPTNASLGPCGAPNWAQNHLGVFQAHFKVFPFGQLSGEHDTRSEQIPFGPISGGLRCMLFWPAHILCTSLLSGLQPHGVTHSSFNHRWLPRALAHSSPGTRETSSSVAAQPMWQLQSFTLRPRQLFHETL